MRMKIFTVGAYEEDVIARINLGLIGKSKGGVCFGDIADAKKWAENTLMIPEYQIYALVGDAGEDFEGCPTDLYPSLGRVLKLTKITELVERVKINFK